MKKFILLVLCFFVVALKAMADSGPDLAIYQPGNWTSPLICSLKQGATTPDYTLKKGVTVYARFAIKNVGDVTAPVGDYVIKVGGDVVVSGYAPVNLQPGDTLVLATHTFTYNSTGRRTVTCMVDNDSNLVELDESNNDFSATYRWVTPGPDLAICTPEGCTSPLICSMDPDATTPDDSLIAGLPVYVKFGITNKGNEKAPVGEHVIMVDGKVVVRGYAPVNLDPGDTIIPFQQFTYDSTGSHTVTCMVDNDSNLVELDEGNNDFSATYEWVGKPDLAICTPEGCTSPLICSMDPDATTPDDSLIAGLPVYVKFGITNKGNEKAPVGEHVIMVDGKVVVRGYAPVNLDPGDTIIPFQQFTYDSTGSHTVTCMVDNDSNLVELDEGNNDFSATYEWVGKPDLVPHTPDGWDGPVVCSSIPGDTAPGNNILTVGEPVYVNFAVKNIGDKESDELDLAIFVDGVKVVHINDAFIHVDTGSYEVFDGDLIVSSPGVHTITYEVDYGNYEDEIDETNNSFSVDYLWIEGSGGGVNLSNNEGIVDISFTPLSFDDPPGDVNDPLGCVFVDNLFLAGFSPEQIEEGHFSYIDNPEMNQYVKNVLHDLGTCSLYVFLEGNIDGEKYNYSEAAEFDISEDNYLRFGDARVWLDLKYYTRERFDTLRVAREIIEDSSWNFTADLTLYLMGLYMPPSGSTLERGEDIYQTFSSLESMEFEEEGVEVTYSGVDLPPSFDWRDAGGVNWMTPAKNQVYIFRDDAAGIFRGRYYGTCFIMGPVGAAEAFYNIHMESDPDFDLDFSEQHCLCEVPSDVMEGGSDLDVYEYMRDEGIVTEECLPYVAREEGGDCIKCDDYESQVIRVPGYQIVSKSGHDLENWRNTIKEHLLETPLSFSVSYTEDETFWLSYGAYSDGLFPFFYKYGKHVMVLVGWGDTTISGEEVPYWIVKNSVSPDWGDNGYLKMKMADSYDMSFGYFGKPVMREPEVGMIAATPNTDSDWHSVAIPPEQLGPRLIRFADPIVVMGIPSYEDTDPVTVRVKDVTPEGFKFQLDEWDYQDGTHGAEIIPYLVVEKSAHIFGGMKFEARKIEDFSNDYFGDWVTVELKDGFFSEPPVILTQVVTRNGEEAVVTRIRNVSTSSFEIMLQEEEGNDGTHAVETVHYIAVSPGSGQIDGKDFVAGKTSNSVTDNWYTINFGQSLNSAVVLANMNTGNDDDPCALRYKNPGSSSIEIKVEEEQSEDSEVQHASEVVGYLVISDVATGSGLPGIPSVFNADGVFPTRVELIWQDGGGSLGYEIERKEGSGTFSHVATVSGTDYYYLDEDLSPGTSYTYRMRAYNYFGYSDYTGEVSATTGSETYESGEVLASTDWQTVDLLNTYYQPVVIMGPPSYRDTEPVTIRVKEVNRSSFEFQIDEWDYLDGNHPDETVSYLVMDAGVYSIGDGIWETGSVSGVHSSGKTVNFKSGEFDEPPVILAQVVTRNNEDAVVTRIKSFPTTATSSFKIRLQEQELDNDHMCPMEDVHYIAISPGSGQIEGKDFVAGKTPESVTHDWYTINFGRSINSPLILANMNTENDTDPAALRYRNLNSSSVEIKVEEEKSVNENVEHDPEIVGYLAISADAVPIIPDNLNATAVSGTQINLTWVDKSNIENGFKIERKQESSSFSQVCTVGPNVTSWSDTELEPEKTYTYRVRAYNDNGDSDYSNEASATTAERAKLYEFDKISISQSGSSQWHTVDFSDTYNNPIIVMGPPSYNNTDPTTVRVKDVTDDGFKFQLDEWDYLDGSHPDETISYIVMEKDVHDIGGEIWEAGSISEVDHNWKTVDFESSDFDEAPVVLAQTVTTNDALAVVTRIKDVTTNSFKIKLQEQKSGDGNISLEEVHYIAVQPNHGDIDGRKFLAHKEANCLYCGLFHSWYNEDWTDLIGTIDSPVFIAGMQSCNEEDPCALRFRNLSELGVDVRIQEENSVSNWGFHSDENLGYLVVSGIEPELSTVVKTETKEIYENYIKLASPVVTGNIVLNVSSNSDRKAQVELIDIAGRIVERKNLKLKRGREDLSLGQFKSGVYFLRIKSDEENKHEVHKITVLR